MQNPVAAVLSHPHCVQIDMTIRRGGTTRPDNLRHAEPRSCRVVSPSLRTPEEEGARQPARNGLVVGQDALPVVPPLHLAPDNIGHERGLIAA